MRIGTRLECRWTAAPRGHAAHDSLSLRPLRCRSLLAAWKCEAYMHSLFHVRMARRHRFHANVRALPLDGREAPAGGITVDLSTRGAFVSSTARPAPGSLLVLHIYGPKQRVRVLARVVHLRADHGYGCEFVDVDPSTQEAIRGLTERPGAQDAGWNLREASA